MARRYFCQGGEGAKSTPRGRVERLRSTYDHTSIQATGAGHWELSFNVVPVDLHRRPRIKVAALKLPVFSKRAGRPLPIRLYMSESPL